MNRYRYHRMCTNSHDEGRFCDNPGLVKIQSVPQTHQQEEIDFKETTTMGNTCSVRSQCRCFDAEKAVVDPALLEYDVEQAYHSPSRHNLPNSAVVSTATSRKQGNTKAEEDESVVSSVSRFSMLSESKAHFLGDVCSPSLVDPQPVVEKESQLESYIKKTETSAISLDVIRDFEQAQHQIRLHAKPVSKRVSKLDDRRKDVQMYRTLYNEFHKLKLQQESKNASETKKDRNPTELKTFDDNDSVQITQWIMDFEYLFWEQRQSDNMSVCSLPTTLLRKKEVLQQQRYYQERHQYKHLSSIRRTQLQFEDERPEMMYSTSQNQATYKHFTSRSSVASDDYGVFAGGRNDSSLLESSAVKTVDRKHHQRGSSIQERIAAIERRLEIQQQSELKSEPSCHHLVSIQEDQEPHDSGRLPSVGIFSVSTQLSFDKSEDRSIESSFQNPKKEATSPLCSPDQTSSSKDMSMSTTVSSTTTNSSYQPKIITPPEVQIESSPSPVAISTRTTVSSKENRPKPKQNPFTYLSKEAFLKMAQEPSWGTHTSSCQSVVVSSPAVAATAGIQSAIVSPSSTDGSFRHNKVTTPEVVPITEEDSPWDEQIIDTNEGCKKREATIWIPDPPKGVVTSPVILHESADIVSDASKSGFLSPDNDEHESTLSVYTLSPPQDRQDQRTNKTVVRDLSESLRLADQVHAQVRSVLSKYRSQAS